MQLEVRLFATLREYAPEGALNGVFVITLPEGTTLVDLLAVLGIGPEKVHLRMVNGVNVNEDRALRDNDRVGLFPPIGGG